GGAEGLQTALFDVRGDGRRRVDGEGATLPLDAAARATARPDGVASIAHAQRDRGAGREASASRRADVDLESDGARGDRLTATSGCRHGQLSRRGAGRTTAP